MLLQSRRPLQTAGMCPPRAPCRQAQNGLSVTVDLSAHGDRRLTLGSMCTQSIRRIQYCVCTDSTQYRQFGSTVKYIPKSTDSM